MKGRSRHNPAAHVDIRPLPRGQHELPVTLNLPSFSDQDLILGKFNKLEALPRDGEQLIDIRDEGHDVNYTTVQVGRVTYGAPHTYHPDTKLFLLFERKDNGVVLSKISKELYFYRRAQITDNDDELNAKTMMLMKRKRIKNAKDKDVDDKSQDSLNDLVKFDDPDEMEDVETNIKFAEINDRNKKMDPDDLSDADGEGENDQVRRNGIRRDDSDESESSYSESSEN